VVEEEAGRIRGGEGRRGSVHPGYLCTSTKKSNGGVSDGWNGRGCVGRERQGRRRRREMEEKRAYAP
jgi:hypothetical protein